MKKIKILYEDANILALDKPAGISVHQDARMTDKETLVDFILAHDKKIAKVG